MKQPKITLCAALLALCLLAAGCASRDVGLLERNNGTPAHSEEGADPKEGDPESEILPDEESDEPKADPKEVCAQLLADTSIFRMEDFTDTGSIQPDQFITFYFMANYDGADKLPIPEGYRQADGSLLLPGADVEEFVTRYFDVSPATLQQASNYQAATTSYIVGGQGAAATSKATITALTQDGDTTTVTFDNFLDYTGTEQSDKGVVGPVSTRELVLELPAEGDVRFTSLKTTFQANMEELLAQ